MRGKASPHAYEKAKVHLRKHPMPALIWRLKVRHMDPITRGQTQDAHQPSTDVIQKLYCLLLHSGHPLALLKRSVNLVWEY